MEQRLTNSFFKILSSAKEEEKTTNPYDPKLCIAIKLSVKIKNTFINQKIMQVPICASGVSLFKSPSLSLELREQITNLVEGRQVHAPWSMISIRPILAFYIYRIYGFIDVIVMPFPKGLY